MLDYNVPRQVCHITTFIMGYVKKRCAKFVWMYIMICMKVRLGHSSKLISHFNIHKSWSHIVTSSKLTWHCNIHEVYVTKWHTTMSLSHCDINESWCCIVTFIKVDVEISQCDIHQIRCWIITSIKVIWHCNNHQTSHRINCDIKWWVCHIATYFKHYVTW